MNQIGRLTFCALLAASTALWSGCKTQMPKPSGFLSDYSHLSEVNDSTWQYVDAAGLSNCDKFIVAPVKIVATEYLGTEFSEDQKNKLAQTFHDKIVKAVSAKYQVVSTASPTTGEIRVALTRVYRVGNAPALGAEAEIINSDSHKQLAALTGAKLGPPELGVNTNPDMVRNPSDTGRYVEAWWNKPAAEDLMNRWADNVVRLIQDAKTK
jgi:hypothetical protein